MKKTIFVALLAASVACNSTIENKNSADTGNKTATANTTPPTTATSANSNAAHTADAGLNLLKSSVGKTASDIRLWENKEISGRLEKLLGADYAALKKYWQTQTPIQAEENVLSLSGCEDNNCGGNQWVMFADTASDNINVHHFKNGAMKTYREKGEIALPKGLAKDFETIKENAGLKK